MHDDIVIEIPAAVARNLILSAGRSSRSAACFQEGSTHISSWLDQVSLRQDGADAVADLTSRRAHLGPDGATEISMETRALPLSGLVSGLLQGPAAQLTMLTGGGRPDVALKVLEGGQLLAVGVDPDGHAPDPAWETFSRNFLRHVPGAEVAAFVGQRTLLAALERWVVGGSLTAGLGVNVRLRPSSLRSAWGEAACEERVGGDRSNAHACLRITGTLGFDGRAERLDFEAKASVRIVFERAQQRLSARLLGVSIDLTGPLGNVLEGPLRPLITSSDVNQLLRDAEAQIEALSLPLADLRQLLPGASAQVTQVSVEADGLYLFGDALVLLEQPPVLSVLPRLVTFQQTHFSACNADRFPASFEPESIAIGNAGHGRLFMCAGRIVSEGETDPFRLGGASDPRIRIAADGRSFEVQADDDAGPDAFQLRLGYEGGRETNAQARLLLLCNAPAAPIAEVMLQARVVGRSVAQVTPRRLELSVANTVPGTRNYLRYDCRTGVERFGDPAQREAPAGFIHIANTGDVPLYVCFVDVSGAREQIVVDAAPNVAIAPGGAAQLRVRFFPQAVDVRYRATVTVATTAGDHVVQITARVAAEAQRRPGGISGANEEHLYDLLGERACLGFDGDICRGLEPFVRPRPGVLRLVEIDAGPLPREAVVLLADAGGTPVLEDHSGARARSWLLPWIDGDGFTGNPCIARARDEAPGALRSTHLELRASELVPGGLLRGIAELRSVVADRSGVHVLHGGGLTSFSLEQGAPCEIARRPASGAVALPGAGLLLALERELTLAATGECVARMPSPILDLQCLSQQLFALCGDRLVLCEVAADPGAPPRFEPRLQLELPHLTQRLLVVAGGLLAIGPERLSFFELREREAPELTASLRLPPSCREVSAFQGLVLLSEATSTRAFDPLAQLRHVASYFRRHWSVDFRATAEALYQNAPEGVRRFELQRVPLDRSAFPGALQLRYAPR